MTTEMEIHGYEFISISWAGTSKSGKTNTYSVTNNRSGGKLGTIMWWGPWRQYVFFPQSGTLYSKGCLHDIEDFIDTLR